MRFALARDRVVDGITVFLFPALAYHGHVVDPSGAPAAGAKVRLLGTPVGEQRIDSTPTEWTADAKGDFDFNAADDAVLEAARGSARGVGKLDRDVTITKQLQIKLVDGGDAHDQTTTGRVVGGDGAPIADALVRADPAQAAPTASPPPRATAFAVTDADGHFALGSLDRGAYALTAEAEGYATGAPVHAVGGARDVALALEVGEIIAGTVATRDGAAVPSFTLLAYRADGARRDLVSERSVIDATGAFSIHVPAGDYELVASAVGWAPTPITPAHAGDRAVELVVSPGATLRGRVSSTVDGSPVQYARVQREARSGGASAAPANAGTVTREDGTFELTGLPAGPIAISIGAGNFHPKIEAGLTAIDGEDMPPIAIGITPLAPGESPTLELVGIGVKLVADGDALRVDMVVPNGGAADAGVVVGDHIVAVDGQPAAALGVDGAVAKIRGVEGTTVAVGLRRNDQIVTLTIARRRLHA